MASLQLLTKTFAIVQVLEEVARMPYFACTSPMLSEDVFAGFIAAVAAKNP